jgi:hypothetical protein
MSSSPSAEGIGIVNVTSGAYTTSNFTFGSTTGKGLGGASTAKGGLG